MYLYQTKPNLLYNLHPLSLTLLTLALVGLAFVMNHPLLLLAILVAIYFDIMAADLQKEAAAYMYIGIMMSILIILINLIFNHHGQTVLLALNLPGGGQMNFTLEVLAFSVAMSLRLLIMLAAFCLFTYLVDPDHIIKSLARRGGNVALALAITLRLLPVMIKKVTTIKEIQSCRGVDWEAPGFISRVRQSVPLLATLLSESLEDAMQMAQSLHTRGFGVGPREVYQTVYWTHQDTIFTLVMLAGLGWGTFLTITGSGTLVFYPELAPLWSAAIGYTCLGMGLVFSYPAIWCKGWQLWHYSKSIA